MCGTCHVVRTGRAGGNSMVKEVREVCKRYHLAGLVRRIRWSEGDGEIFFPVGNKTTYEIGLGQEIDLILMRYGTDG